MRARLLHQLIPASAEGREPEDRVFARKFEEPGTPFRAKYRESGISGRSRQHPSVDYSLPFSPHVRHGLRSTAQGQLGVGYA